MRHDLKNIKRSGMSPEIFSEFCELLWTLLQCERAVKCDNIITKLRENVLPKITQEVTRFKCDELLQHLIEEKRCLPYQNVFSNGWTCQSAAEVMNSVLVGLKIQPNVPFVIVLDRVICCLVAEEKKKPPRKVPQVTDRLSAKFIGHFSNCVTPYAMKDIKEQFYVGIYLEIREESPGTYTVFSKSNAEKGKSPHIVRAHAKVDGLFVCTCNRRIYKGLLCRHICKVYVHLAKEIPLENVHSRWLRDARQPAFVPCCESPFKATIGMDSDVKDHADGVEVSLPEEGAGGDFAQHSRLSSSSPLSTDLLYLAPELIGGGGPGEQLSFESEEEEEEEEDTPVQRLPGVSYGQKPMKPIERRNMLMQKTREIVIQIGVGSDSAGESQLFMDCLEEFQRKLVERRDQAEAEGGAASGVKGVKSAKRPPGRPPSEKVNTTNFNKRQRSADQAAVVGLRPRKGGAQRHGSKRKKTISCSACSGVGHNKASKRCPKKKQKKREREEEEDFEN